MLSIALVIIVPDAVSADSNTWTTDTDFQSGTIDSNLVLKGTGVPAYMELRRADFPDWMQMAPATVPAKRDSYCLAWIEVDNSFLMFGGYGSGGFLNDTWKYSFANDQWTPLVLTVAPSKRAFAGCEYDPINQVVVLFGGMEDTLAWSAQTWWFDANTNTWTQKFPTGFNPRNLLYPPMTYDRVQRKMIVLAQRDEAIDTMETWAYDASTNQWENRNPGSSPSLRDGHAIAYEPTADYVLLFSGAQDLTLYCDIWTYSYSSNAWTFIRDCIQNEDPNGRVGADISYRQDCQCLVLFGGYDGTAYDPSTWYWLFSTQDWIFPLITGTPFGRRWISMASSPVDNATVLFGGTNVDGLKNDTWALAPGYVTNVNAVWTSSATPQDAGCDNVNYDRIYWNRTAHPLGAALRFQFASSAVPGGPWQFRGPDGFPGQYYTVSGSSIFANEDSRRYFRVLAVLRTGNGRVTPVFEDVTVTWACPPTPPYVSNTNPANGATDVPLSAPIWVNFSEPMNTPTVTWAISGGITLTGSWSTDQTLLLTPDRAYLDCTQYTVQILTGKDVNDDLDLVPGPVPNPWSFTTVCVNPYITNTNPADGDINVPVAANIIVTFSEPMNTGTVTYTFSDPGITFTESWNSPTDTVLTLTHTTAFTECTLYDVNITAGKDDQNLDLVPGPVANPWSFFSFCNNPFIVETDPVDGATNVPLTADVIVTFSEPMLTTSVAWTITGGITLTVRSWTGGGTILTLMHATPFAEITTYTAQITAGTDPSLNPLVPGPVPNPWDFTTLGIAPNITSTDPVDGAVNVPVDKVVTVTFSEGMNTGSVTATFTPFVAGVSYFWTGNTVVAVSHAAFAQCTQYLVQVAGFDLAGIPLGPGPVPNPWSFRTFCPLQAPGGLTLVPQNPNILLDWRDVPGATIYRVYESQNRFAPFPGSWTLLGTSSVSQFLATGHLADPSTHYYIVRATDGITDSPNSSMGVKIIKTFAFTAAQTNIVWFSLPFRSQYTRASDVAADFGSTNIDVVGKWDAARQRAIVYYYARGGWRGTNFVINPGDGLYVNVRQQTFTRAILGTDLNVTLSFTLNGAPLGNVNWISVPYTGVYTLASQIANELGPGKVVELGLWDPATQSAVRWYWTGSAWTGTDFTIAPGAGVYLIIASSFTWNPRLVTSAVP